MHVKSPGQGMLAVILIVPVLALAGCSDSSDPGVETEVASTTEASYSFDTPPVLKTYPTPEYPDAARKAGLEGKVNVRVLVSTEGTVMETKVLDATDDTFVEAATSAMAQCRFEPALKQGKPTRAMVIVPVQFSLH